MYANSSHTTVIKNPSKELLSFAEGLKERKDQKLKKLAIRAEDILKPIRAKK